MAWHNLTTSALTRRVLNATAAGSTNITTATTVDTRGYEGVRAICLYGTITDTSVTGVKLQQSSDDGATDTYDDIAGSLASMQTTGDSSNMAITDIFRPGKRYVKAIVTRATANAAVDAVLVELYHPQQRAVAKHTTVSVQKILSNPAEGTA